MFFPVSCFGIFYSFSILIFAKINHCSKLQELTITATHNIATILPTTFRSLQ